MVTIINDPSHICGNREMIEDVSQVALDLNFDGLMIETHCDPDNAWSDAAQQITSSIGRNYEGLTRASTKSGRRSFRGAKELRRDRRD